MRSSSSRPATVWVVGPVPPPVHGASRVTSQVLDTLRSRGDVRVVVVDTGDGGPGGLRGVVARLGRLVGGLGRLLVARRRSGSVYVGGAGGGLLWYQALVVLLARVAGLRVVFHHHSFAYVDRTSAAMSAVTRAGGPSLVHVVLGPRMEAGLRERYAAVTSVLVCSNAALMPEPERPLPPRTDDPEARLVLGHLSNLSVEKGLQQVVDTAVALRDQGTAVRLLLAGPTTSPEADAIVDRARADLGPALEVLGRLGPDEVDDFQGRLDVFLFPSRYVNEAEPLVVLEAERNGVPVFAHAVGCLPDVLDPARLVATDVAFAPAVARALRDASLPDRDDVAAGFARRRAAALDARQELLRRLVGVDG